MITNDERIKNILSKKEALFGGVCLTCGVKL